MSHDIQGQFLGQVQLIFRPKYLSWLESPSILLHVESFKPAPGTYSIGYRGMELRHLFQMTICSCIE